MRDRVRPPKELDALLDRLKDDKVFDTKQKGMMFAAALGYHLRRGEAGSVDVEQFGEAIRLEVFSSNDDAEFIDALAVADCSDLNVLAADHQDERVDLFQRYAHLGARELKRACYDDKPDHPLLGLLKLLDQLDQPPGGDLPGLEGLL